MAADMTSLDSFDRDNKYKTTPSSKKIECQTLCQFKYYFVIQYRKQSEVHDPVKETVRST